MSGKAVNVWKVTIETYYNMGLYSDEDVAIFVGIYISEEEYKEITGKDYVA